MSQIYNRSVSFEPNEALSIRGSVTPTEESFGRIEFYTETDDCFLIHFTIHGIEFITVPDAKADLTCPIDAGTEFEIIIKMAFHGFEVWIDNKYFASMNYTFTPLSITAIHISAFDHVDKVKKLGTSKSPTGSLEQFGPDGSWWASMYDAADERETADNENESDSEVFD